MSTVTKQDIEEHFSSHGSGKITEIKLMNGFGFIEYEDALDARDVVPGKFVSSICRYDMYLPNRRRLTRRIFSISYVPVQCLLRF